MAINDNYGILGINSTRTLGGFGCKRSTQGEKMNSMQFFRKCAAALRGCKNIRLFFAKDEANQFPHRFRLGLFVPSLSVSN